MYQAITCSIGYASMDAIEKKTKKAGVHAFNQHIEDFIQDVVKDDEHFPPLIFFYEPLQDKATNMVLTDMPENVKPAEIIKRMSMQYIAENRTSVEKIIVLTPILMFRGDLNNEEHQRIRELGLAPSQLPPEMTEHGMLVLHQQQDESSSHVTLKKLGENNYEEMTINEKMTEIVSRNPDFDNFFDQGELDKMVDSQTWKKIQSEDGEVSPEDIKNAANSVIDNLFNKKYN